jgi:Protein of unknown function (DUF4235)
MSLVFKPIGIAAGALAGLLGKQIYRLVWGLVDDEDPPEPKHREIAVGKLALALLLEGAIYTAVRGLTEHGARRGFAYLTGQWPGEERPEPRDER